MSRMPVIVIFTLMCFGAKGQYMGFAVEGNATYRPDHSHNTTETGTTTYLFLIDSLRIRTVSRSTTTRTRSYEARAGYHVQGTFAFNIGGHFRLSTGIGLSYQSFAIGSDVEIVMNEILSRDTTIVEMGSNPFPGPSLPSCDVFENSYGDIEFDPTIRQEILSLRIPLNLAYVIGGGPWQVECGVFAQTPVYTVLSHESVKLESSVTETGETSCVYTVFRTKNTSGNSISNLQAGVSAGLRFHFSKKLALSAGVTQVLSNMFVKEEYQVNPIRDDRFAPMYYRVGMAYTWPAVRDEE